MDEKQKLLELSTKIERLESKDQALDNIREMTNKRIDRLSEQIGEVKELFAVLSQEKKEIDKNLAGFEKLVEKTHPEQLLTEVRSIQKQQMILEGKFDLMKSRQTKFQENFESFSEKLKVFKGEDELLKLQKRVAGEFQEIERINRNITMNASKVENSFIKIKEKVVEATTARDDLNEIKKDLLSMKDDLQKKFDSVEKMFKSASKQQASAPAQSQNSNNNTSNNSNNGGESNDEVQKHVDELTDAMIENFGKMKERIKALEKISSEHEILKKWVAYLVKKERAQSNSGKSVTSNNVK
jgi:DNA repair exonuclease SbcCD ATPase subunit